MRAASPRLLDELPRTADLAIVGGGVVGAATAFFAARAGLRVLVIERRRRPALQTTAASTGAFRLQFDNAEELALVREGVELFVDFAGRTGLDGYDIGVRQQGYLFCARTEASAQRARDLVEQQRGWGLTDVEILPGDDARRRFPYLSPQVIQARYRPGDGWLDPLRLTHGYLAAAADGERIPDAEGPAGTAHVLLATEVLGFTGRRGERVTGLETSSGQVSTGAVVLATGPFLAQHAALAGVDLPLAPTRRQKLVIPALPDVPPDAPMTIDEETAAHWRPALSGCYALFTEAGTPPSEPVHDVPVERDWALGLLDPTSPYALAHVAPFWRDVWERGPLTWFLQAGQYEYTPDRRPYIGESGVPGLWLNGGYSGHGVMTSPGGSRLLVELLTAKRRQEENPFRVDRAFPPRMHDVL